jgi:hypothetical protein
MIASIFFFVNFGILANVDFFYTENIIWLCYSEIYLCCNPPESWLAKRVEFELQFARVMFAHPYNQSY